MQCEVSLRVMLYDGSKSNFHCPLSSIVRKIFEYYVYYVVFSFFFTSQLLTLSYYNYIWFIRAFCIIKNSCFPATEGNTKYDIRQYVQVAKKLKRWQ